MMDDLRNAALLAAVLALGACGDSGSDQAVSARATLARQDDPQIERHPQSLLVKDGESAMFNVTGVIGGSADAPLRYQWRRNDVDLPGETKAWLMLERASLADDQARYTVVISSGANRTVSAPGVLAVVPADTELPWR